MTDWLCTGLLGFRIRLPVTSATRFWREQECVRRGGCSGRPAGRLRPSSGPLSCGRAGLGPQGQERVAERLSPKGHFKRERQQPPRTAWRGPVWPGFSVLIPMAVCRPRDARSCCGQATLHGQGATRGSGPQKSRDARPWWGRPLPAGARAVTACLITAFSAATGATAPGYGPRRGQPRRAARTGFSPEDSLCQGPACRKARLSHPRLRLDQQAMNPAWARSTFFLHRLSRTEVSL